MPVSETEKYKLAEIKRIASSLPKEARGTLAGESPFAEQVKEASETMKPFGAYPL
jgi:hypothetical protein